MSLRDELFAELGIAPTAVPAAAGSAPQFAPGRPAQPTAPPSATAFRLDRWSIRQGEQIAQGDVLRPILTGTPDAQAAAAAADFYSAAFEPITPELAERCTDPQRHRFLEELTATQEFSALHASTQLDPLSSELAAGHFAQGWRRLADQEGPEEQPQGQGEGEGEGEGEGTDGTPGGQPARGQGDDAQKRRKALAAAGEALQAAQKEVSTAQQAAAAFQWGSGDGQGGQLDLATAREHFRRIKDSYFLRQILELAGRYRRVAQACQRRKTAHGMDDVLGIEQGNDLSRLLPVELAMLADDDPTLELYALKRWADRQMLQRRLKGVEKVGRGPVVFSLDESGSMDGDRILNAKALALAVAWVAQHQGRYCVLHAFSSEHQHRQIVLPAGRRWNQEELLDYIQDFYDGGTSFEQTLSYLPRDWQSLGVPHGKTDLIIATDGQCEVKPDTAEAFRDWKAREQVKAIALYIGTEAEGELAQLCDMTHSVRSLTADSEAVEEILSI